MKDGIEMPDLMNLRVLKLHCALVTSSFLETSSLSKTSSKKANNLKQFHIMLMSGKETKDFYNIPLKAWKIFFQNHPYISLHVTLANTIPESQLFSFFNSTIMPHITSITIASYVRYPANLYTHITNISSHHRNNLTKLCDYTITCSVIINLIPFLNAFPSIDDFTYNGEMYNKEVIDLVSSRKWRHFNVCIYFFLNKHY